MEEGVREGKIILVIPKVIMWPWSQVVFSGKQKLRKSLASGVGIKRCLQ